MTTLKKEFKELWVELGRDPEKLALAGKTDEELEDGIEKLKAIKMSFKMLYSKDKSHKLAIALLAEVFGTKIEGITHEGEH